MLGNEPMSPETFLASLFQVFSISTRLSDLELHAKVINKAESKFSQVQEQLRAEGIDDADEHLLPPVYQLKVHE